MNTNAHPTMNIQVIPTSIPILDEQQSKRLRGSLWIKEESYKPWGDEEMNRAFPHARIGEIKSIGMWLLFCIYFPVGCVLATLQFLQCVILFRCSIVPFREIFLKLWTVRFRSHVPDHVAVARQHSEWFPNDDTTLTVFVYNHHSALFDVMAMDHMVHQLTYPQNPTVHFVGTDRLRHVRAFSFQQDERFLPLFPGPKGLENVLEDAIISHKQYVCIAPQGCASAAYVVTRFMPKTFEILARLTLRHSKRIQVVPIAITYDMAFPFLQLRLATSGGFLQDIWWTLFQPSVTVHATWPAGVTAPISIKYPNCDVSPGDYFKNLAEQQCRKPILDSHPSMVASPVCVYDKRAWNEKVRTCCHSTYQKREMYWLQIWVEWTRQHPWAEFACLFFHFVLQESVLVLLGVSLYAGQIEPGPINDLVQTTPFTALVVYALKITMAQPRPTFVQNTFQPRQYVQQLEYTFPSGHTAFMACVTTTLAWQQPDSAAAQCVMCACLALTILTGWARMLLGVHFPRDVVAGLFVGTVTASLWMQWVKPSWQTASVLQQWMGGLGVAMVTHAWILLRQYQCSQREKESVWPQWSRMCGMTVNPVHVHTWSIPLALLPWVMLAFPILRSTMRSSNVFNLTSFDAVRAVSVAMSIGGMVFFQCVRYVVTRQRQLLGPWWEGLLELMCSHGIAAWCMVVTPWCMGMHVV